MTSPRPGCAAPLARSSLSVSEVAFLLEVDERAVRNLLRRGELRDVGAGRLRRADPDEIRRSRLGSGLATHALEEYGRRLAQAGPG